MISENQYRVSRDTQSIAHEPHVAKDSYQYGSTQNCNLAYLKHAGFFFFIIFCNLILRFLSDPHRGQSVMLRCQSVKNQLKSQL